MRRHINTRDILRLEGRSLWSRLYYSFPSPVEEPKLKQLVQLLRFNIKMNREYRPSRPSVPVTSSFVISAMASLAEETHPVCNNSSVTSP
jgi:hypothetical protein